MCQIPDDTVCNHSVETLRETLLDESAPIAKRTRCVFLLRQIGSHEAMDALAIAMKSPSVLLGHEVAFVLGQMRDTYIIPTLIKVLKDSEYHPIVRHEAGEAIGAIADLECIDVLAEYAQSDCLEVAETCQIALERVKFIKENPEWDNTYKSNYNCVDPAPPLEEKDVSKLQAIMNDSSLTLFQRYRAMFSLRDINNEAAVLALASGFADASPVLRHEIAYVFGQIQHAASIPSLITVLSDVSEHSMVRHEAAEALGSVAEDDETVAVLRKYQEDADRIVKESCDVALDIHEYWISDEVETAIDA